MSGTWRLYTTPLTGSRKCCVTKTNFGASCAGGAASSSPGCFASSIDLLLSLASFLFSSVLGFSSPACASIGVSVLVSSLDTAEVVSIEVGASVGVSVELASLGSSEVCGASVVVTSSWPVWNYVLTCQFKLFSYCKSLITTARLTYIWHCWLPTAALPPKTIITISFGYYSQVILAKWNKHKQNFAERHCLFLYVRWNWSEVVIGAFASN